MKPREECAHLILNFGSGDFYLFCHSCGARWATIDYADPTKSWSDEIAPQSANKGLGAHLSGHARVAAMGAK
jgi:hypothetical protein